MHPVYPYSEKANVSIDSDETPPIYRLEELVPEAPFRGKARMMMAGEAQMKHLLNKQNLGEISFSAQGINESGNIKMGSYQHCYLSALGYWVVSRQKKNFQYTPGYFNAEIQIGKIVPKKKYLLELDHRKFKAFDIENTQIDIIVNNKIVLEGYSPPSLEFTKESFDLTKYLKSGLNTVTLSYSKTGETIYAIRALKIIET